MTDPLAGQVETNAGIIPAGFSIGGLFGTNGPLTQIFIYGIVSQLLGAAMAPVTQEIQNAVWPLDPSVPLSPADLALAVIRDIKTEADAAAEAKLSGISSDRFHVMQLLSGDAPAPDFLAVAERRGFIDDARFTKGVAQGRMRTEWADVIKKMAVEQPSPQMMLNAYLEGQLSEAEARSKYAALGGDPAYFDILFNTQGQAPSPLEAAEAARRGIIPWTGTGPGVVSFEQAVLEGPTRNKWLATIKALAEYIPPPRTITAMYKEGSITHDQAVKYFKANGVPDDLLAAFLSAGTNQKTQPTKDLAQSYVLAGYEDKLITRAKASDLLVSIGYDPDEAAFILAVQDFKLHLKFLGLAVSKVHSQYVSYRIDRADAVSTLGKLEVDPADVTVMMQSWDLERDISSKSLTPAEIASALHYDLMSGADALQKLQGLGYALDDAWLYLAAHLKGSYAPIGDPPPGVHPKYGPNGPGPTPPVTR